MQCHICDDEAKFLVYIAYDEGKNGRDHSLHPRLGYYLDPFAHSCPEHLGDILLIQTTHVNTTAQWCVKTIALKETQDNWSELKKGFSDE